MKRAPVGVRRSLKKLRKITGDKQSAFAEKVGVSYPLIREIECGNRSLSPQTANKIGAATGCNSAALMKGKLLNREGRAYTPNDFKTYKSSEIGEEDIELIRSTLKAQYKAFGTLLSMPSAKQKVYLFEVLFNQFVEQATKSLECEREYDRLLIEQHGVIGRILVDMRHGRVIKASAKKAHNPPTIKVASS